MKMTNREIDALIAEKVFGYLDALDLMRKVELSNQGNMVDILNYSTDIKAAWEVVEKLMETIGDFSLYMTSYDSIVTANFHLDHKEDASLSYTAPMAICLAALKAVGVEV